MLCVLKTIPNWKQSKRRSSLARKSMMSGRRKRRKPKPRREVRLGCYLCEIILSCFPEIDKSLKQLRPILQEYKNHLRALENGESFTPTLTAKASKDSDDDKPGKKRKRGDGDEKKSSKRRRTSDSDNEDDDDFIADDDEELVFTDEEDGSEKGSDEEVEDDLQKSSNGSDEEEEESAAEEEEVTEESLKANIKEAEDGIKEGRVALSEQRRLRKEAVDALAGIKKRQVAAQRQKNAFCSLRRSEVSRRFNRRFTKQLTVCLVLPRRFEGRLPRWPQGSRW